MRKNVWKRFLAATLAAVVMFTSVDCTGLVVNAEGTTKTLGEILADYYEVSAQERAILTDAKFKANTVTYDVKEPANLDGQITLDVVNKKISVPDVTNGNVVWKPESVKVIIEGQKKDTTFSEGYYQYDYSGTVEKAEVVYRPTITPSVDDQLMWLNAPIELETAIFETGMYLESAVTSKFNKIAPLAKEIYTADESDDIVSDLILAVTTIEALNDPKFDAALELGTSLSKPSDGLKSQMSTIKTNANILRSKFKLDNVFVAFDTLAVDDKLEDFWLEYVDDLVMSLSYDADNKNGAMDAISALATDGSLEALAAYCDSLGAAKSELEAKISEYEEEFAKTSEKYAKAKEEYAKAEEEYAKAKAKYDEAEAKYAEAEAVYDKAMDELDSDEAKLDEIAGNYSPDYVEEARAEIERQRAAAKAKFEEITAQFEEGKAQFEEGKAQFEEITAQFEEGEALYKEAEEFNEKLQGGKGLIGELDKASSGASAIRNYAATFNTFLGKTLVKDYVTNLQIFGADKIDLYFSTSPATIPTLDGCVNYTDADKEIVIPGISTTVVKAADAYNVTVKIEADVVDLDSNAFPKADARPLKSSSIVKSVGKNQNDYETFMSSVSSEILEQLKAWDAEAEAIYEKNIYGLSEAEDAYNLKNYSCEVTYDSNISGGKINGAATITVRYTPNTYNVKIDGEPFKTVSHGQYIILPKYTGQGSSTKSYEYSWGGSVYKQEEKLYITENIDFTSELVDSLKINPIVVENYGEYLDGKDGHKDFTSVFESQALISDTIKVDSLSDAEFKSLISVFNTEDKTLATLKTRQASDDGTYTWVPRKIVVLNEGIPTGEENVITPDQIVNGEVTVEIESDSRTSIQVEYALVVAVGDAAYAYVNLPNELALGVKKQFDDWKTLISYSSDLAILDGTTLPIIAKLLNEAQKDAIETILKEGCVKYEGEEFGSGNLILNDFINGFKNAGEELEKADEEELEDFIARKNAEKIIYYYQHYEDFKYQLNLIAKQVPAIIMDDMTPAEKYISAEQVQAIRDNIGRLDDLTSGSYFTPRDERISDVSWNAYTALMELLVPTENGSIPEQLKAVDKSKVDEVCETYTVEKGNLPESVGKTVYVDVVVEYNGERYQSKLPRQFKDKKGLGEAGVAWVKAQFEELSKDINSKYYESNAEEVNKKVTADVNKTTTFTYVWTPKTFTFEIMDENQELLIPSWSKTYTSEGVSISLPRPDSEDYMYVYSINGKDEQVTYAGASTEKVLTKSFEELFTGSETTLTITRKREPVPKVRVNINFVIYGTTTTNDSTVVPFPETTGMSEKHIEAVKKEAELFATQHELDNEYYTFTSDVDGKLSVGMTTPTTVTFTWTAKEYTFKLQDETGTVTDFAPIKYDKREIQLPVPPTKGQMYVYTIGNSTVYVEPGDSGKHPLTDAEFKALLAGNSTITRTVDVQKATVTIKVVLKDSTGGTLIDNEKNPTSIVFNVPDGLGQEKSDAIETIAKQIANELANARGINKEFYDWTVDADVTLVGNKLPITLDKNATVIYTWTPKIYTVKFADTDAGTEQNIPYDHLYVELKRPDSGYVYHYDFNGKDIQVPHKEGATTYEASLARDFAVIFGNNKEVTVKRTVAEEEAIIHIVVTVESAVEGVDSEIARYDFPFGIGKDGLSKDELEKVKAKAAALANEKGADDIHYTYVSNVDEELSVGHKAKETTVTYTYSPKTYDVYVEGAPDQKLTYGNVWIKVPVPEGVDAKYRYYYNINGKEEPVDSSDYKAEKYDDVLGIYYKLLNVSSYFKDPTADFDSIKITRRQVVAAVEDASNFVQNKVIGQDLALVFDALGVKESVEVIQYNQVTESEDTNGKPKALVIRLKDTEEEDSGIVSGVMATLGAFILSNNYVWMEEKPAENTGLVVEPTPNTSTGITIRLQNAINAILGTGVGTESIAAMFDSSNATKENVSVENALPVGVEPEKLGAELLKLNVGFGSNEANATELQLIFTFFDEKRNVTDSDMEIRNALKGLSDYLEVTAKDGRLTVDVKEKSFKDAYETYLMMMLLEGETDFANVNNVTLTDIVEREYERFAADLGDEEITVQTLENTLEKLHQKYDLNADPNVEKIITKLIGALQNEGYKNDNSASFKFYLDKAADGYGSEEEATLFNTELKTEAMLDAASTMGFGKDEMELITNSLDDAEMNGHLDIPTKLTVDGINSNDVVNNHDYAALIINVPSDPENMSEVNEETLKMAANAIELVEANYFENKLLRADKKVPDNSFVVLLTDTLADSKIKFEGNGILDLNGHDVKEVIGKDKDSAVVVIDSTYHNGSVDNDKYPEIGKNVKDARQTGEFYTIEKVGKNLKVKLNGEALANAATVGTSVLEVLAIDLAFDLIMNNISSGDMLIDEYDIYDVAVTNDIFTLIDPSKGNIINDVIDVVKLGKVDGDPKNVEKEGLFGFINDLLASLTTVDAIRNLADRAADGKPIMSYTVGTNPMKLNLTVAGKGDGYITAAIKTDDVVVDDTTDPVTTKPTKSFTVDFVVDQKTNTKPLIELCNELETIVKESNINVDLDDIKVNGKNIDVTGASVNATLHVDLLRGTAKVDNKAAGKTEVAGNHDYAAIIAMVAAYGEKKPAKSALKEAVEDYLTDGSIDQLRKEVENITVEQLIKAVKNANGKTFAEIATKLNLKAETDTARDRVADLAKVYDDLFRVIYRVATIVSDKLGIDGDSSKLGSLAQKPVQVKEGDVTFTYYSYGGDYEGERQISQGFMGIGAKAEGSVYADLSLTLFAEDDYQSPGGSGDPDPTPTPGGNQGGSGSSSGNNGPVEVHPAPTNPATPSSTTGTATGDTNNMALWISVMGVAIIAVVSVVVMKKKRTK